MSDFVWGCIVGFAALLFCGCTSLAAFLAGFKVGVHSELEKRK